MTKQQLCKRYGIHLGLTMFAAMLLLPILTPYLLAQGFVVSQIAIAMVVMTAVIIISEVPSGALADHFGRRRLFCCSLVFALLTNLLLLIATDFVTLLIAVSCWGLNQATLSGTLNAWFVERFHEAEGEQTLNQGFAATYGLAYGIGASSAVLSALFLAFGDHLALSTLQMYQLIFVVSSIGFILLLPLTFHWVKEVKSPAQQRFKQALSQHVGTTLSTVRQPALAKLLIALVIVIPVSASIEKFWPIFVHQLEQVDMDAVAWLFPAVMAATFALNGVAAVLSAKLCTLLNQKLGQAMAVAHLLKLVALVAMALAPDLSWFVAALLLFFLCFGLTQPAQLQLQHQLCDDSVRATIESLGSLTTRMGGMLGAALTGALLNLVSLPVSWLLLGALSLLGIVLLFSPSLNQQDPPEVTEPEADPASADLNA
ncbi:MFS transporter [Pseudoalteromonas ardens]|uniref:MFS transporter n=1 Tax=Pseudoalteromonas rubra TaxID=43658 RepID=A0A0L0EXD4_9GAMM|nr:MFS transporter [Pseudoalteromonas sp. R96]KNC68513.1 MFS transporter [Pseudoalteromonas rubra]MDK1314313.1 MFS transporter [Pseudoalteromonas sp. R96]